MNERILELAIEARKYAESKPDIYQVAYDKKFAELIVKECAQVDADFVPGYGLEPFSKRFKEHYGVEE